MRSNSRMIIGEERAVDDAVGRRRRRGCRVPREDRPGQPVYTITAPPPPARRACGAATLADLDRLLPGLRRARTSSSSASTRCSATTTASAGAMRRQIEEGRSWLWLEDDVILFKAEASAWTPAAVQMQQVWVDPEARGRGYAEPRPARPLPAAARDDADRDALRAHRQPAAIGLYESIGMKRVLSYRSILFP